MAITNYERVGKAVQILAEGLAPFVDRECRAEFGDDWPAAVQRMDTRGGGGAPRRVNPADAQFLLKVMWDEWRTIFGKKLSRSDRNYVSELQGVRNSWAHNDAFSTDDALRALDTAQRLLESAAAGAQANEVGKLHQDLLRQKFDQQMRGAARKAAAAQLEGRPATGLPGWREVVTPHDDVTSGRFELAEFAADLHQVWRGEAADEYGDPAEFFRRTFITEGIGNLITGAARRFSGAGGDPVIKLQTNFGGGKTHALIALYHLAGGAGAGELPGVEEILAEHGLELPAGRPIRRAVLVGHQLQPSSASAKPDGTAVNTMWGELAWQLGGAEGYELVAESDRAGTNPGEALTGLLRVCSPCLILIDEWVAYARQLHGVAGLPAGSFDAHFSFAQALTDAARNAPEALLVATIPASDIEVGGEGGKVALTKLENLFSRMETNWRTASTEESFEIVRRRLFGGLDSGAARQRDAVVKAFGDLYRSQAQRNEFPPGCGEGDYERRMKSAYPIHPELFDRLFGDWSELERFQRTRGVLRLMAKVIHSLWVRSDPSLLIMPATIPIDDNDVAAELIRYLDDGWRPVIETDIDGPESLPLKLDKANPNLGRYSAARRIARTVYFGSAPSQEAANKGLDDRAIKLGCVQPGEAPATFGDALRKLSDQAMHLYRDGARYWYSLQPTVTRLAQDRAQSHFSDADVDEAIRARLDGARSRTSLFAAVHACPRSPGDVPDEGSARLVVLDPTTPHDSKTDGSEALEFAGRLLDERGAGARRCRNMLVFLAADKARLDDLRAAVRQWLAWKSIDADRDTLNLDNFQVRQIAAKLKESDETVDQRVAETYQWVLAPNQPRDNPTGPVRWDPIRVAGSGALAERVAERLKGEEALIPAYSGTRLRLDIDLIPLWRGSHVGVDQLWDDYTQYLYLPRLTKRSVLEDAIRDGVRTATWEAEGFGYADGHDGERYVGLRAYELLAAVAPSGLVVAPDAAAAQRSREQAASGEPGPGTGAGSEVGAGSGAGAGPGVGAGPGAGVGPGAGAGPGVGAGPGAGAGPQGRLGAPGSPPGTGEEGAAGAAPASPALPTRYYGRLKLDSNRWAKTAADVAEAIVDQLARTDGAEVSITIEVEAESPQGFDDRAQRTVTENATTLKFDATEFEN